MKKLHDRLQEIRSHSSRSVKSSKYISIDNERLVDFAEHNFKTQKRISSLPPIIKKLPLEKKISLTLMFSAINYCFIHPDSNKDYAYDKNGERIARSNGVIYALTSSGLEWNNFKELSKIKTDEWREILQLNNPRVVLYDAEERVRRLKNFSIYLSRHVDYPVNFFTHYNDAESVYKLLHGSAMFEDVFCKRMQIALLWLGEIATEHGRQFVFNKSDLTAMADYRLPQIMCQLGIIKLRPEAMNLLYHKVTNKKFENDMRSAVIEVCFRISKQYGWSEANIDSFFWNLSQVALASQTLHFPAMRVATRCY